MGYMAFMDVPRIELEVYLFLRRILRKVTPPTGIRRSARALNNPDAERERVPNVAASAFAVPEYPQPSSIDPSQSLSMLSSQM